MREKWLAVTRTKNPLVWNSTNSANAHDIADAMPTLGRENAA